MEVQELKEKGTLGVILGVRQNMWQDSTLHVCAVTWLLCDGGARSTKWKREES